MHPHETLTKEPNPINDIGFGPETKFETRLEALRRENRERRGMIEAAMAEAEAKGELWTVQAATGTVIPVMRMPDGMAEKVLDQYEAQTAQKKRLN